MTSVRPKSSLPRPSRRVFDHEAALAFWHNAGGQRRTYGEVAAEFGVSERGVWQAAQREDWSAKAWELDERGRREAEKRQVKTVAQRIERALQIVDATAAVYARGLQSGRTVVSASEMASMLKLEQLLVGGPSERFGIETGEHARSLEAIEAELAALDPAQVDALVAADQVVAERVLELDAGEVVEVVE